MDEVATMLSKRRVWINRTLGALACAVLLPAQARAEAEVKLDRDYLDGLVQKLPTCPFRKEGRYRGNVHAYRLLGIDPRTRRLLLACQAEGEFRSPIPKPNLIRSASDPADPLDHWRSFRFDVQVGINVEAAPSGTPRFRVDVEEVKRRELEGFAGMLAKLLGKAFDEIVTQVADGKASHLSDRLNAEILKRIKTFENYGVFRGIDYTPAQVVLHFDLTRYKAEGITCYVYPDTQAGTVPLHRWRHRRRGDRVYSATWGDPDQSFYQSDGIACYVHDKPVAGTVPLYRWSNRADHFYTTAPDGERAFKFGYRPEGIACYVYREPKPGTIPLFRFVDPRNGAHFCTTHPHAEFAK